MRNLGSRRKERLSDEALLAEACRGDGDAFAAFYRRHLRLVLAYLRQRTPGPEVAADLTAETFAAALSSLADRSAAPAASPVAWLMTIAHNKLVDSLRRGRVEDEARVRLELDRLALEDGDLERVEEMTSQTDLALELARSLPADELTALRARILEERDYSEIAGRLGCSESLARQRVSRALRSLRARLEE